MPLKSHSRSQNNKVVSGLQRPIGGIFLGVFFEFLHQAQAAIALPSTNGCYADKAAGSEANALSANITAVVANAVKSFIARIPDFNITMSLAKAYKVSNYLYLKA